MDCATLSVVATPIGNLGDITNRALDALREADVIFCEDTRVTGKLLAALDIEGAKGKLRRLDENMLSEGGSSLVIRELASGKRVAYCSDAGMPAVSDPGQRLVAAVRDEGYDVDVLPGASAASCALVASGILAPSFHFAGFLPRKQGERDAALAAISHIDAALIFYESPKRLTSTLASIADAFPKRQVAVCRELTKLHEEVVRGSAEEVAADFSSRESIRGEIAIVVGPPSDDEQALLEDKRLARASSLADLLLRDEEPSNREIMEALQDVCGISRNDAYDIVLAAAGERDDDQATDAR